MRLFIAINLEEEIRKKISLLTEELKRTPAEVKWVKTENLHLTLKFLGETAEEKISLIGPALARLLESFPQFEIKFSGLGAFPNLNFPRVVWIGIIEGSEKFPPKADQPRAEKVLSLLSEKIENSLVSLGFDKEERPFTAHLTLGRVRSARGKNELVKKIIENENKEIGGQKVEKVHLIQSILRPTGPVYIVLKEWHLG